MEDKQWAEVGWTVSDVLALAPLLTAEQAENFLSRYESQIEDRIVELGVEVIRDLIWRISNYQFCEAEYPGTFDEDETE